MTAQTSRDEQLFAAALARPEHERAAFLDGACHDDAELKERILTLLKAHAGPESLLAGAPGERPNLMPDENPGDVIARYKILQKIGEGGCGVVWMAEQEEPVRRRVALKVIKLGMDTKAVVARFEAERQALAMMDHPCIAKVHDAGSTDTGRPYFVMELVRGIPITKYCDENHLTPNQRLELFIKVCHAIQHAHQKGVIHRDIKPSNILVTVNDGAPTPKVIDFGIAKATQGKLTDATVFTAFEQFIGTPVYMSPEQAEMSSLDIDTRSDVYSLGVLLYELLAGRPPFDPRKFAQAGVDQIRKQIREVEPARPSARLRTLDQDELTTIARLRGTVESQLTFALRGDLDWIVMRCIEKDRTRRYDTANGLATDIQRYLRNEPVVARPPSTGYLTRKLILRHRFAFAAAGGIMVMLMLGVVAASWQAVRAKKAEHTQSRLRAVAEHAQAKEADHRARADREALSARRRAYASDMTALQHALANDNLGRARELLARQRPAPGDADLRGWEWRYLWQFCQGDHRLEFAQKSDAIVSVAVSADGKTLGVGEETTGVLAFWDFQTRFEARMQLGRGAVRVAFSPTHPIAAGAVEFAEADGRPCILFLNMMSRQVVRKLPLDGYCNGLVFSHDGATLYASTLKPEGQITLWRVADGSRLRVLPAPTHNGAFWGALAIASRRGHVAHALPQGGVRVLEASTGAEVWRASATQEQVMALATSPDERILATGAGFSDGVIKLWDLGTGKLLGQLEGHRGFVSTLSFSPDGSTLISGGGDQTLRIWQLKDRRLLRTFRGHKLEVWNLALLPDSRFAISGSKDGAILLWDIHAPRAPGAYVSFADGVVGWRFIRDGGAVLTVDRTGGVEVWEGNAFQRRSSLMNIGSIDTSWLVHVSAEYPLIVAISSTGRIRVWNWERRTLAREFDAEARHAMPLRLLAKGERLLVGAGDPRDELRCWNTLQEWDLASWKRVRSWSGPADTNNLFYSNCGVAPDESSAFVIWWDQTSSCIDLTTGESRRVDVKVHEVDSIVYSPNGNLVTVSSGRGVARVFAAPSFRNVATLTGFMLGVHSTAFSPDVNRLLTTSNGTEAVKVWDAVSYHELLTLEAQGSLFQQSAFSPDGDVVAAKSSSGTGTLHVWRAPSWAEIEQLEREQPATVMTP